MPSMQRASNRVAAQRFGPCRAAALSLALAFGCSTVAPVAERTEDFESVMTVDGVDRHFQVHLPEGYTSTTEYPLLIALHGGGGRGETIRNGTDLDAVADSHGVIMVYPDGAPGWVWDDSFSDTVDDIKFIEQLIERVDAFVSVDRDRVYVTGFSAGGMMTHKLACVITNRLAAAVMVGATLPTKIANTCHPLLGRRFPVAVILSTLDAAVPFEGDTVPGDFSLLSANETMRRLAQRNDCSLTPTVSVAFDDPVSGVRTRREVYPDCGGGVEVELYAIEGGGHGWPEDFFPTSETVMAFLLRHRR